MDRQVIPYFPEFKKFGIDLSRIDKRLIDALIDIRYLSGIPITPSPSIDGWYRDSGSEKSRHYAIGRLSDAGDIFPARGRVLDLWLVVLSHPDINGIGLYTDTNGPDGRPWIMMHIDLRQTKKLLWIRDCGKYYYLDKDKKDFWSCFEKVIEKDIG